MSSTNHQPEMALEQVGRRVQVILAGSDDLVGRYVAQVSQGRGKLLRPQLLMAIACIFGGGRAESIANCAACCELLHTASLVHDDVIDEADRRRGIPTLNRSFGNEIAVVVGDYLLALVFRALLEERDFKLADMLLATSQELGLGVIEEVHHRADFGLSPEQYRQIIYFKTAALFKLCCEMGAYLAQATPAQVAEAGRYGKQLGLAFQVVDDLLDITLATQDTGKPAFNDLREGRITLPLIHAFAEDAAGTSELVAAFQDQGTPENGAAIRAHLLDLGSLQYAYDTAVQWLAETRAIGAALAARAPAPEHGAVLAQIERRVIEVLSPFAVQAVH